MKKKTVSLRLTEDEFRVLEENKLCKETKTDFIIRSIRDSAIFNVIEEVYPEQSFADSLRYLVVGNFQDFLKTSYRVDDIHLLAVLDKICSETFSDNQVKEFRDSIKFRKGIML